MSFELGSIMGAVPTGGGIGAAGGGFDLSDIMDAVQSGGVSEVAALGGSAAGMALGGPAGAAIGGQLAPFLISLFGPGYDPSGGGEIRRQLAGTDLGNDPHALQSYLAFMEKEQPYLFSGHGSIWDQQGANNGNPSDFYRVYKIFRDAGLGEGAWILGGDSLAPYNMKAWLPDGSRLDIFQVKDAVAALQNQVTEATAASKANVVNGTATPGEHAVLDSGAAQTASIIPADAGKWLLYALAAFVLYRVATK